MPYRDKLSDLADERGTTIDGLIEDLIEEYKTPFLASINAGVYPNAVRYHLKRLGYKPVNGKWVKPEPSGKEKRDGASKVGSQNTAARPDKANTSRNEGERITASSQS